LMGVWATVNGIRAMVVERVVDWDGEEHFRVLYSRDNDGAIAKSGIPGIAYPPNISWDCKCSTAMVPTRIVGQSDKLTEKEVWELERQWAAE